MADTLFHDGEEMHFLMDDDGKLYMVSKEVAEKLAAANRRGTATIQRVDPDSNTVWFSTPLPDGLRTNGR